MALSIRDVHGDWDHAVCGVWGCSPPLAAVAACQAVWMLILFPAAFWVSKFYTKRVQDITAKTVIAIACVAFAVLVVYEFFHWFLSVAPADRIYFGHRITLATFAQVDIPIVVLLLSGLYLRWRSQTAACNA